MTAMSIFYLMTTPRYNYNTHLIKTWFIANRWFISLLGKYSETLRNSDKDDLIIGIVDYRGFIIGKPL